MKSYFAINKSAEEILSIYLEAARHNNNELINMIEYITLHTDGRKLFQDNKNIKKDTIYYIKQKLSKHNIILHGDVKERYDQYIKT
jgi:tRNA-dihydrouridine synthase